MLHRLDPYWLWALLALPGAGFALSALRATDVEALEPLLHPSGEFAARLMIVALLATPLARLLPGWRGPRWLLRHRRHFGVAAFGYAALHTVFYLIGAGGADAVLAALPRVEIWTGWLALALFAGLAALSNNASVRAFGPRWKRLQRWVYVAAALSLLHWAALHDWGGVVPALANFAPLLLLSLWRVWPRRPAISA